MYTVWVEGKIQFMINYIVSLSNMKTSSINTVGCMNGRGVGFMKLHLHHANMVSPPVRVAFVHVGEMI